MKKMMMTLIALLTMSAAANAMSYEQARNEALFLTDKMAYELDLTDEQYEAAYEINLDYLMGVTSPDDVYGVYWERRNLDMSYILYSWQWEAFRAASYFFRPLYWNAGRWHFGIYARYTVRDYFYFGRPHFYVSYRGGHAWHVNGGHSYYYGRRDHFRPAINNHHQHYGMRQRFDNHDYRPGSSTRVTAGHRDGNRGYGLHNDRGNGNNRNRGGFGNGNNNRNRGGFGNGNNRGGFGNGNNRGGFGNGNNRGGFGNGNNNRGTLGNDRPTTGRNFNDNRPSTTTTRPLTTMPDRPSTTTTRPTTTLPDRPSTTTSTPSTPSRHFGSGSTTTTRPSTTTTMPSRPTTMPSRPTTTTSRPSTPSRSFGSSSSSSSTRSSATPSRSFGGSSHSSSSASHSSSSSSRSSSSSSGSRSHFGGSRH